MSFIKKFFSCYFIPHSRVFWGLLFLGFVFYESCGLYFQYYLHLNPCIECVYERACFMFFAVAAIIGLIAPRVLLLRLVATLVWLASSVKGLLISIEHRGFEVAYVESLKNPFAASETCGFFAEFPSWFKLDEWLPQVFAPTGICGDAAWSFASLTMVQWVEIIFACNTIVSGIFIILCFFRLKK